MSTLLKLIYGDLIPTEGMVRRHNKLKLGIYGQHLHEFFERDLSPPDYMMKKFPEFKEKNDMRKVISRYGITGKDQTSPIIQLSDGIHMVQFKGYQDLFAGRLGLAELGKN